MPYALRLVKTSVREYCFGEDSDAYNVRRRERLWGLTPIVKSNSIVKSSFLVCDFGPICGTSLYERQSAMLAIFFLEHADFFTEISPHCASKRKN